MTILDLLPLVPLLPLAGFVVLALAGRRLARPAASAVGVGSVGLAAALAGAIGVSFMTAPPTGNAHVAALGTWMSAGGLDVSFDLRLDALSLVMILVVTGVGFLIHLYSAEFMASDESFSRFFAAMNLFVFAMLVLVLADDLVLLYLGWEGVGLCSYLLIGFWYTDPANGHAARKAFVVTRVGDTAMAVGLMLIFRELGTLRIPEVLSRAQASWQPGDALAVAAAALLLGGAVGKSAQLPLQTWLPDAMAGPTPVSALIHAATMVTAGVYLIARTHVLFELAPAVQLAVAIIGAVTLLLAAFAALAQRDIKRVLAYSTISQIGYMFLALGVGAWSAAVFHLMTHAFFKALLFLAAGAVILALDHEHDIFKMGGLARSMPVTFWTFLAGAAALAGFPLVTAGFYSKDLILWRAFTFPVAGVWLWLAGLAGAFLTAVYIFRVVFIAFLGEEHARPDRRPGWPMAMPLVVLGTLAVVGGFVEVPHTLGGVHLFSDLLHGALPAASHEGGLGAEIALQIVAAAASLLGIGVAWWMFGRRPHHVDAPVGTAAEGALMRLWASGWGFDRIYDRAFVRPYLWLASVGRDDVVDYVFRAVGWTVQAAHRGVRLSQTGRVRFYAAGVVLGAALLLALVVLP